MRLKGKVAVVTGGGRGIGRATALRMAREGASVVVNDIEPAVAEEVVQAIQTRDGRAVVDTHAVGSFENGEAIVQTAVDAFGRIDILFNNAGFVRDAMVHKMTEADWDAIIQVHLKGAFANTRAAYRYMREQQSGKIVNVTSASGLRGNVGQANYCAAKAGIIGLTKSNAKEFGKFNVQVNAISPNAVTRLSDAIPPKFRDIAIQMTPLGRFGEPEEIAAVVCFLASSDSDYVTGQIIAVDGGIAI
jgi:3-oxoacyl-[acyl-carrier protein] reductase